MKLPLACAVPVVLAAAIIAAAFLRPAPNAQATRTGAGSRPDEAGAPLRFGSGTPAPSTVRLEPVRTPTPSEVRTAIDRTQARALVTRLKIAAVDQREPLVAAAIEGLRRHAQAGRELVAEELAREQHPRARSALARASRELD
jgi:hypothetical protein